MALLLKPVDLFTSVFDVSLEYKYGNDTNDICDNTKYSSRNHDDQESFKELVAEGSCEYSRDKTNEDNSTHYHL